MPLQNRVTPTGEIVAATWRGALMGNRGCLHDDGGRLGVRRWRHQNWVCCVTAFRGRQRDPMPAGRWTALFFWDEAAALSAGHRPCGECRHRDYQRFMAAWRAARLPGAGPREVDRHLHLHRVTRRREQVRFTAQADDLPDGVFVLPSGRDVACVVAGGRLHPLLPERGGYGTGAPATGPVTVLTPAPIVEVIRAGYVPAMRLELP